MAVGVVEPAALLALAGPFADPRVGVVAGRVLVYNRHEGIIPRMLHVRFMPAFDFLRADQSTFGTVYCSPGALSAYRAGAVRQVMDAWLNQRFLGAPATYGEDRALTNDLMRLGYDSVYQRLASVLTLVPTTYGRLCRMFLRWERSFVREELRFAKIVRSRPLRARLVALADVTITNLRYPVMYATLALLGMALAEDPMALIRTLHGVMGGFHLSGTNERVIPDTVEAMREFDLSVIAAAHCTGWRATGALAAAFGDAVVPSAVGKCYRF